MKFYPGIKARIFYNIIVLAIVTILAFIYMFRQITERDELIRKVTENYQPSLTNLAALQDKFEESIKLIHLWANNTDDPGNNIRDEFNSLFNDEIPGYRDSLTFMAGQWADEDLQLLNKTAFMISDSLYFACLEFISAIKDMTVTGRFTSMETESLMQEQGLIFIISEIEQNLNFLSDKRNLEITGIFNEISEKTTRLKIYIIILSVFLISLLSFMILSLFNYLNRNITLLKEKISQLAEGRIPETVVLKEKDEFRIVNENLNNLFRYLRNLTEVANRIGEKDFSTVFTPLGNQDELGNAMLNLQDKLRKAGEEQQRYLAEEQQRSWVAESVAKINDILRVSTDKLDELGYLLIRALVDFTDSRLGGLFILNNDHPEHVFIELISAYAYDRKKNLQKTILPGEGLVGRCFMENETIYLTDVPRNYLCIKSGLGENDPFSLLLVPIHLNETVYGVVELASFSEIEKYKIRFVEMIGENIATTISNLKINLQTGILLEQTRQQAEELLSQEEEMRQNMEELRLTQEETEKKEGELLEIIRKLKSKSDQGETLKTD